MTDTTASRLAAARVLDTVLHRGRSPFTPRSLHSLFPLPACGERVPAGWVRGT